MTFRVFVFGTLKSGFPNHTHNSGRKIAGFFSTVQPYPLYLVGERHSPWMVHDPGQGYCVRGEVYEMERSGLDMMDSLERIQCNDGYRRLKIDVRNSDDSSVLKVFAYFKSPAQYEAEQKQNRVKSGPFPVYTLEHASRYQSRH